MKWNFIFERARPFSFYKGCFNWKTFKSIWKTFEGTKAKTRDNKGHGLCVLRVTLGLKYCQNLMLKDI